MYHEINASYYFSYNDLLRGGYIIIFNKKLKSKFKLVIGQIYIKNRNWTIWKMFALWMKEYLVWELLHERSKEIWSVTGIDFVQVYEIFNFLIRLKTFKLIYQTILKMVWNLRKIERDQNSVLCVHCLYDSNIWTFLSFKGKFKFDRETLNSRPGQIITSYLIWNNFTELHLVH